MKTNLKKTIFRLNKSQWAELLAKLEAQPKNIPAIAQLLQKKAPWEEK